MRHRRRVAQAGETMKASTTVALLAIISGASGLSGCAYFMHGADEAVHDSNLTTTDYNDAVAFEAGPDAIDAEPPIPVHELDTSIVEAAGGARVIDGDDWLNADDWERNDLLNQARSSQPDGTTLVIEVATGDVWAIPPGKNGDALFDLGAVRAWDADEYDRLRGFVDDQTLRDRQLTRIDFKALTAVAGDYKIYCFHDFGAAGRQEIETYHGFQILQPRQWVMESPVQRELKLRSWQDYLIRQKAWMQPDETPRFSVMVPQGSVFVVPQFGMQELIARGPIGSWTDEQIYGLADVLLGPDHDGRFDRPTLLGVQANF
jgi:hypothetical protein